MKNVDCSLYSGNGKYIMAPSKEWDTIAQYLTDEEIQQICKGYIRVMRIYKISPDSFIFLIQVQFFPSYYLFKTIKFPIFNFFIYHSAFSLHYLVLKF